MKLFLTFALAASCCAFAQQTDLTKTLVALDAALFDSYNKCQLDKFVAFFDEKVEFYHDQAGVTFGKKALAESLKKNICGKVIRKLVPGTMQVHEMKNFGALQMGVHLFRHPGREAVDGVGQGQFIHLWQLKDGAWKIVRVISYDHHPAAP